MKDKISSFHGQLHSIFIVLILLSILCSNCKTTGHFTNNPKNKISFAGTEFILTQKDSFHIRSWTDVRDIRYNNGVRVYDKVKYRGKGTYQKEGDSLHLLFSCMDSIRVDVRKYPDSRQSKYTLAFYDELGHPMQTQYEIVEDNQLLHQKRFMGAETDTFSLKNSNQPIFLKIVGYVATNAVYPKVRIDSLPYGQHRFHFKTYNGYFARNEERTIWFKTRPTGIRYELNGRRRYLPRKWKWKFLNRFYRDY